LNINNYFNVYKSSYNQLNAIAKLYDFSLPYQNPNGDLTIPDGANQFINYSLQSSELSVADYRQVFRILERVERLTENNLILSSAISYIKNTRSSPSDHSYSMLKTKIESAGSLLNLLTNKKDDGDQKLIFDIPFSQFIKADIEFTKQWDLKSNNIIAIRGFLGFAKPFGNSKNIPFIKSYFAGGANDIRAWRPYSLGPGKTETIQDFNEANFKLTCNAEYRFKIYRSFRGAIFADTGNIWHLGDDLDKDEEVGFLGLNSLKDLALATGVGLRYDFSMFIIRIDWGFKTHNPALAIENRWLTDFRIDKSILNFGVNYPF